MADIFISYSRKDSEQALALVERLRAGGLDVWIDQHGIEASTSWSKEIANALKECHTMLILLSPTAVASANVAKELSVAAQLKKRIVPVQIERVQLEGEFLYHLSGLQRAQYSDFDSILRAITKTPNTLPSTISKDGKALGEGLRNRRKYFIGIGFAFLALLVGTYFFFFSKKTAVANAGLKSLLVLPFESLSADKENDYFADGMTATLIDMLVPIPELRVTSRSASMEFKSSKQDIKSIASLVGCRYVVGGTVQRQGDHLMIHAQMTDVETGSVLFSKSFPGNISDLMKLQQQIARNIVVEMQLVLGGEEFASFRNGRSSNPEAWNLCMKADYEENHGRIDSSISLYLRGADYDPQCAYSYLQVAREYGNKYNADTSQIRNLILADSFLTIGKRLDTAQQYSHYVASWIATCHRDFDRAITEASIFITKEPSREGGYFLLGLAYTESKQHALAADNFIEDLKRDPSATYDRIMLLIQLWAAKDTLRLREYSVESLPIFEAWLARHPEDKDVRNNSIPLALVWAGRGDEACKRMEALLASPGVDSQYVLNTAAINALSGKTERAMDIMRGKVVKSGVKSVDFERPFFDNIRSLPEFKTWVKQKEALTKKHV
jgi:TolB-like protein